MLATSHFLIAGVILKMIPDPRISLPLILASHPLLDLIPHWDVKTGQNHDSGTLAKEKKRFRLAIMAAGDVLLGIGLTFWLFKGLDPVLLLIALPISQLPDWIEMPYLFGGLNFPPSIWVKKLQSRLHSRLFLPWGLVTQLVILIPLLWWTLWY